MADVYRADETLVIDVYCIDTDLSPLTGVSDVTINIQRHSDSEWFDFDGTATFEATGDVTNRNSSALTEVDATNKPGIYRLSLDLSTVTNHSASRDRWLVSVSGGTGVTYKDQQELIIEPTTELFTSQLPAATADAVWDEAKSGHVASGSFGEEVQAHSLTSEIVSAAAVADAVWEEAIADHSGTAGSTAEALSNISATAIADQVWEEAIADHSGTSGSTAEALANADVSVTTVAGAIRNQSGSGVIANELTLKVGDLLPVLTGTLYQDGVVFDLTGYTVQVRWRELDTGTVSTNSATVVSATAGTVKYAWSSGDTSDEGRYSYEWIATRTSDSAVQTFPGHDYKTFRIVPILD